MSYTTVPFPPWPHSKTQLMVIIPGLFPSDFLLLVLKDLMVNRPDMKIILMSATLNANLFSEYFYNCNTIHIPGRPSRCVVHGDHARSYAHTHTRATPPCSLLITPFVLLQVAPSPWTSSSSKTPSPKPGKQSINC